MFASNETSDRGRFHRLLERAGHEGAPDGREACADAIEAAIKAAASAAFPPRNRVARPVVVLSAASALSAVARALRDDELELAPATLASVRAFLTDGSSSPLYGSDPLAARRAAEALRLSIDSPRAAPLATAAAVT